jgi:hypothetical protein
MIARGLNREQASIQDGEGSKEIWLQGAQKK